MLRNPIIPQIAGIEGVGMFNDVAVNLSPGNFNTFVYSAKICLNSSSPSFIWAN
jgi:hypothetical protein